MITMLPLKTDFRVECHKNVSCESHLGKYIGVNANDTMIEKSISKFIDNFNCQISIFKDCGYEIKYKLFKTFCMDVFYGIYLAIVLTDSLQPGENVYVNY